MKQEPKITAQSPLDVKLFATPREVTDDDLRGCSVVIVDVLRSSATIACALMSGAREIIPVLTPAEAGELASRAGRGMSLLCGEREGRKIDGFDLGNSPFEYTAERVNGRIIIFSSTNGSAAVVRSRLADHVYVGGYNNFAAVIKRIVDDRKPIVIVCAGKMDQFAIEDFVCGGKFIVALESKVKRGLTINDGARAASLLHKHFDGNIPNLLKNCNHGQLLMSLGAEQDIEYCSRLDIHPVVPMLVEGKIRGYKPDGSPLAEPTVNSA
ncbi:2-phosphosulfolactate phosphatase [candidate division KSB1 bacterium]|nr:MAG: 2-phosphosulfolactate phosphatase [candidate division KSB1 bacterium]